MEQWEKDLNRQFGKSQRTKPITAVEVYRFVQNVLGNDRNRDRLQELIDYVKDSKSNTDILIDYIIDSGYCVPMASDELCKKLNLKPCKELIILGALEQYYKDRN